MLNQKTSAWPELAYSWIKAIQCNQPLYLDISEDTIGCAYSKAYALYQAKNYEQASYFFYFLVCVRPLVKNYWKGLGGCQQGLKNYKDAILSYQSAQEFCQDSFDPYICVHQADCFFALNQIEAGLNSLKSAHLIANELKNTQVINHVKLMREAWCR